MKKEYIIQTGENNPILRHDSEIVDKITSEIKVFCGKLLKIMWENNWVWLAAPQVGNNVRIIATSQWRKKWDKDTLLGETIMINPVIVDKSKDMILWEEACLSLPDIFGNVKRHKIVTVEFLDIKWIKQKKKYKDLNAVIIQHEIDHLDWVLFTDKLVASKKGKEKTSWSKF